MFIADCSTGEVIDTCRCQLFSVGSPYAESTLTNSLLCSLGCCFDYVPNSDGIQSYLLNPNSEHGYRLCSSCFCIARGFGYTRAPWKASKPQSRHGTLKPQSRKAAKPPWNAQAAQPQSCHGTRKPQSRKAAEPQALRLMRRLLRSSPLRCHRHGSLKPQSRKAASSETQAPSPVFIAAVLPERQEASKSRKAPRRRSTTKRQSGKASRSAKASRSVKASRSGTAPKRQRAANERLAVLSRGRACLRKEVCNQRLAVFRRGRACILRDNS